MLCNTCDVDIGHEDGGHEGVVHDVVHVLDIGAVHVIQGVDTCASIDIDDIGNNDD